MFLPFDRFLINKLGLFSQIHLGFVLWRSADLSLERFSVILLAVQVVNHIMLAVIFIVFWIISSVYSISWLQSYIFRQTVQLADLFDESLRFLWRIQLPITSALLGQKEIWDKLALIILVEIHFCCKSRFVLESGYLFIRNSTAEICCDLRRHSVQIAATIGRFLHVSAIWCTHIFQFSVVGCPFTKCILFARMCKIWAKDLARAKSPGWRSLNRGRVGALLRFHNARNYPFKLLFSKLLFLRKFGIFQIFK